LAAEKETAVEYEIVVTVSDCSKPHLPFEGATAYRGDPYLKQTQNIYNRFNILHYLKLCCLYPVACIRSGSGVSVVRPKHVAVNFNKIVNNY
jgi:hypothetical protein